MRLKTPGTTPPAVSAILLSYNCEQYVAAALESVLEQDYRGPLEIIVSDDASTDRTFAILEERLARYAGPHRIALRRRPENSGSKSAHLNDVLAACTGHLLISFDGDDIALPSRVSRIVARFAADDRVQAVYSSLLRIDEAGRPRGGASVSHPGRGDDASTWFARVDAYAAGSTLATRRTVIDVFGPLDPTVNEDVVLPFRASLIGKVEYIPEPLVKYRRHSGSLTADWQQFLSLASYRERMHTGLERANRARRSRLKDLETASAKLPQERARWERLRAAVEKSFREAEMTRELTSESFIVRMRALLALLGAGAYRDAWLPHTCLALAPRLYLRYKRSRLRAGTTSPADGRRDTRS